MKLSSTSVEWASFAGYDGLRSIKVSEFLIITALGHFILILGDVSAVLGYQTLALV